MNPHKWSIPPPVADAGPDKTAIVGEIITFDGSSSFDPDGAIVSFEWEFGDGATGSGETPTHVYSLAGMYTVTLTVTDNDGAIDTDSATVTVKTPSRAIQDLVSEMEDMNLPGGIENSLISKLDNAIKFLHKGREDASMHQFNIFIKQVEKRRGKEISDNQADELIAIAQWIMNNM